MCVAGRDVIHPASPFPKYVFRVERERRGNSGRRGRAAQFCGHTDGETSTLKISSLLHSPGLGAHAAENAHWRCRCDGWMWMWMWRGGGSVLGTTGIREKLN